MKYRLLEREMIKLRRKDSEQTETRWAYRIQALIGLPEHGVRRGDIGGYVDSENCLSHEGSAWISDDAYVESKGWSIPYGVPQPIITGNALVAGTATIIGSRIDQMAKITGAAYVEASVVRGYAEVKDEATVISSGIFDNAQISGKAVVRKSCLEMDSFISGNAVVGSSKISGTSTVIENAVISCSALTEDVSIAGKSVINSSHLLGSIRVSGSPRIDKTFINGRTDIRDMVIIEYGTYLEGSNEITGGSVIHAGSHLHNSIISDEEIWPNEFALRPVVVDPVKPYTPKIFYPDLPASPPRIPSMNKALASQQTANSQGVSNKIIKAVAGMVSPSRSDGKPAIHLDDVIAAWREKMSATGQNADIGKKSIQLDDALAAWHEKHGIPMPVAKSTQKENSTEIDGLIEIVDSIEAEYNSYTTDVVKLITYPLMGDTSVPEVEDFVMALRTAKRLLLTGKPDKISSAVEKLERSFIKAENKVLAARQSTLGEDQRKQLDKAEKLFAMVFDGSTTEHEKKVSLKAGMKSLEGIVYISDEAVKSIKAKAGLLEIEA